MTTRLERVGLLRHGQSTGNLAREAAEAAGHEVIDIAERDADVPLSELGVRQARAAGGWLATDPPELVVASPYLRSLDTARLALAVAKERGVEVPGGLRVDERLRDRELGVLDLLTSHGVAERWPDELRRKQRLGKFYYRPPGGESWADVVLRVRSLLAELSTETPGLRVLFVAHEMTVFALRYVLESVPEQELLATAVRTDVPNGSVTAWERGHDGGFRMTVAQDVGHLVGVPLG
ncbi:histidine phosphatase family protein [Amycolatopsis carbonis]|uniref:Histidine phosphatase family protein n=1 Tax=Amycolatopsis carbonis TaxID=715471 RepID=A0A9Y2IDL6_9PSEU|nr:histidine phosphatase family protein [Amycolatopsis sp. 2-15]WIX77807.1 histidine phosphatase family protein [Amycolatopsis sp. 2-15]